MRGNVGDVVMKVQHVIFCDAGCHEVGNELPDDRQVLTVADSAQAAALFEDACRFCQEHVDSQLGIIERTPGLQLTSDYYWTAIWLELPKSIDVGADDPLEAV